MTIQELKSTFVYGYNAKPDIVYFAPSALNLIGEYADSISASKFLPCMSFGVFLLLRSNNDSCVKFWSLNEPDSVSIGLNELTSPLNNTWVQYPLSVFSQFIKHGVEINVGFDILIWGNIPESVQISSEDALKQIMAFALDNQFRTNLSPKILDKSSVSNNCEFSVINPSLVNLVSLCKNSNLKYDDLIVQNTKKSTFKIVLSNTHSPHYLDFSPFETRIKECKLAVEQLNIAFASKEFSELKEEEYKSIKLHIIDSIILKRAKHILGELKRAKDALNALNNNEWNSIGQLMNQTHISLNENMEVVSPEVDKMVSEVQKINGVLGSRMTGCGLGGCSISLVNVDAIDSFIKIAGETYQSKTSIIPEFYVADIGDTVCKLYIKE